MSARKHIRAITIQRASIYILGVVLFSVALFFAGVSTKLAGPKG